MKFSLMRLHTFSSCHLSPVYVDFQPLSVMIWPLSKQHWISEMHAKNLGRITSIQANELGLQQAVMLVTKARTQTFHKQGFQNFTYHYMQNQAQNIPRTMGKPTPVPPRTGAKTHNYMLRTLAETHQSILRSWVRAHLYKPRNWGSTVFWLTIKVASSNHDQRNLEITA